MFQYTDKIQTQSIAKINNTCSSVSAGSSTLIRVSPPPLIYIEKENVLEKINVPTIINEKESEDTSELTNNSSLKKKDIPTKKKGKRKREGVLTNTLSTQNRMAIPSENLKKMQEDTLNVLKDMNGHLERMANSHEKMTNVMEKMSFYFMNNSSTS